MRKNILGALIASAFAFGGSAHAGLMIDLNGVLPNVVGTVINADALDWAQTSFLARGGTAAINNFLTTGGFCALAGADCSFDVMTHARLTNYTDSSTGGTPGLPFGFGEITMVAKYKETVVGFNAPVLANAFTTTAFFSSTGIGSVEFYYSLLADSADLTGSNFNNGRLIGRLTGVGAGSAGSFSIPGPVVISNLDVFPNASPANNNYTGQKTISGFGSQAQLNAGTTSVVLDPSFFLNAMSDFSLNYTNISIALPYNTVNPSDCFNDPIAGRVVGTGSFTSTCNTAHVNGLYSAQGAGPGYLPKVGTTNGLAFGTLSPDFIAQTDYNSAVTGFVPEPGSLALVGLALGSLGLVAARRRRS